MKFARTRASLCQPPLLKIWAIIASLTHVGRNSLVHVGLCADGMWSGVRKIIEKIRCDISILSARPTFFRGEDGLLDFKQEWYEDSGIRDPTKYNLNLQGRHGADQAAARAMWFVIGVLSAIALPDVSDEWRRGRLGYLGPMGQGIAKLLSPKQRSAVRSASAAAATAVQTADVTEKVVSYLQLVPGGSPLAAITFFSLAGKAR